MCSGNAAVLFLFSAVNCHFLFTPESLSLSLSLCVYIKIYIYVCIYLSLILPRSLLLSPDLQPCVVAQMIKTAGFELLAEEGYAVDPKRSTHLFMHNNVCPPHIFNVVEEFGDNSAKETRKHCHLHSSLCIVPRKEYTILVAGFPCSPYSMQRASRFAAAGFLP